MREFFNRIKYKIFIQGLICSILSLFCSSPGFAKTTEGFDIFEMKAYTKSIQVDSSNIFLAKKKDKTGKRQNEIKQGVGTGKGQGLEHRHQQEENKKGDDSVELHDGDKKKKKNKKGEDSVDGDKDKTEKKQKKKGKKD